MEIQNNVIVLGAGESGVGAAVLAKKRGCEVFVSDSGQIKDPYRKILASHNIQYEEEGHVLVKTIPVTVVVKSPGISDTSPVVAYFRQRGIAIISELDFASRYVNKSIIIGVTGSNGKTTTATLLYQLLKEGGKDVCLCGNVGRSFAMSVAERHYDYYVVEVSSFQLDDSYDFHPNIAVLLNITPDHLDRYDYNFQKYANAKMKIVQKQTKDDVFVYWSEDPVIKQEIARREICSQCFPFGLKTDSDCSYVEDETVKIIMGGRLYSLPCSQIALKGQHNRLNVMASVGVALKIGVSLGSISATLQNFSGVEHRMQFVRNFQGVLFINDSKATNVRSCWYALEAMQQPLVLILGGTDKGNDYSEISTLVKEKCHTLIFLGVDNSKLLSYFRPFVFAADSHVRYIEEAKSMREAVNKAISHAKAGDCVLLSPCCASFDLFRNYEDRGEQFISAVNELR